MILSQKVLTTHTDHHHDLSTMRKGKEMSMVSSVCQMQNLGQNLFNSVIILYVRLSQRQDRLSGFCIRQEEDTHSFPREMCASLPNGTLEMSPISLWNSKKYVKENKHREKNRSMSYFCFLHSKISSC